jgi:hypothetical protein
MSMLKQKLTDLANSPQGRKLADRAQQLANDPKTREKIANAKRKLSERRGGAPPTDPGGPKAA